VCGDEAAEARRLTMTRDHRHERESPTRDCPMSLTDDELTRIDGGVQKVREALADDPTVVVGGESISVNS
jgi:hypothetical protein